MTDIAQDLQDLHLSSSKGDAFHLNSPPGSSCRPRFSTPVVSRQLSLFSKPEPNTDPPPEAGKTAAWNAIVGDLFQSVVENLPAHTAQHAMLVCRQWHDSVTNGLICLRPRALRLNCITSR